MPLTTLPVTIEQSCATHPLLPPEYRGNLPLTIGVRLTPKKLFGYAAMRLQDASHPSVQDYQAVRSKAESLIDVYGHTLWFHGTGIDVNADDEIKASVSELVGVGAGLAAICGAFRINPNRVTRYIGNGTGKRMDFMITLGDRRYLLEVRGTTAAKTRSRMVGEIQQKKAGRQAQGYHGLTGALTLYSQGDQGDHTVIVDPPGDDPEAGEFDELASVLEYYHNIYRLTHSGGAWGETVRGWLSEWRQGNVDHAPILPHDAAHPTHRTSKEIPGVGTLRGTLFDRRLFAPSIAMYETFQAASEALPHPTWLLGTIPVLDDIAFTGGWAGLMGFQMEEMLPEHPADYCLLPSGVGVAQIDLDEREDAAVAESFGILRQAYLRARRLW